MLVSNLKIGCYNQNNAISISCCV